ncbi:MAG: hypothetical protein ACI9FN_002319 [Saprospiraceae bacterium]|jgi:hypothetical protein
MFSIYLRLGFDHILDVNGYDHILFLIALCAVYRYSEWRKVLVLVTAFTVGHSITLALSALGIVVFKADVIEFLIPLTILFTAIFNILSLRKEPSINWSYILAMVFGWIHGLGFSNYFKALLGKEESIIGPLLSFNLGVEIGQIIIVLAILMLSYIFLVRLKIQHRDWTIFLSGAASSVAMVLILEAKFW